MRLNLLFKLMQIRAIDNRIASLKKDLKAQNSANKVAKRIRTEINWLEEKRVAVCSGNILAVFF
jgi:hypothetical protein